MATLFDLSPLPAGGARMNAAQRRAIEHRDGPLLVIAGAGTGKTRVITERIRWLLESDPSLCGQNILGLTFTDKAAGEMKARVVKAVGERGKDTTLKTFPSIIWASTVFMITAQLIDKPTSWASALLPAITTE